MIKQRIEIAERNATPTVAEVSLTSSSHGREGPPSSAEFTRKDSSSQGDDSTAPTRRSFLPPSPASKPKTEPDEQKQSITGIKFLAALPSSSSPRRAFLTPSPVRKNKSGSAEPIQTGESKSSLQSRGTPDSSAINCEASMQSPARSSSFNDQSPISILTPPSGLRISPTSGSLSPAPSRNDLTRDSPASIHRKSEPTPVSIGVANNFDREGPPSPTLSTTSEDETDANSLELRADRQIQLGDLDTAIVTLTQVMTLRKNLLKRLKASGQKTQHEKATTAQTLSKFGKILVQQGDFSNAQRAFQDALKLYRKSGASMTAAPVLELLNELQLLQPTSS
jgi:tetratricopeptide (TPR) repeat protein